MRLYHFFNKYPILGQKVNNFSDFCKVAEIMKDKKHLTKIELEQIKKKNKVKNDFKKVLLRSPPFV